MIYTVVGYYEDSNQGYAAPIEAEDQYAAMAQAACDIVIGAFEGELLMHSPSCDNGLTAKPEDMPGSPYGHLRDDDARLAAPEALGGRY
ncbi:MAG: hypothetical protein ABL889_17000 [Terricaulis sp.]